MVSSELDNGVHTELRGVITDEVRLVLCNRPKENQYGGYNLVEYMLMGVSFLA